jgi:D-glycero-D-manno-heptose 1,7-bisphosphate phosphatase
MLKGNGIEEIVMLLGYLPEKITEYLGDGSQFGVRVKYSIGALEDFTGTRLRNVKDLVDDTFLLMYCDNFLHLDIGALYAFHMSKKTIATVVVYNNRFGITKNNVFVDADGFILRYDGTRTASDLDGVELGFFIFKKQVFEIMPQQENFWIADLFPPLIKKHDIAGFRTDAIYYSIGSVDRLKTTERFLSPCKVVFLDRDGVINKKKERGTYVTRWEDFVFLPHVKEAFKLLSRKRYEVYIVSNQAGVARGFMSEGELFLIHKNMEEELVRNGGAVGGIYYCPHGWDDGCFCRKPKPGMLYQAAIEHQIDLPNAIFIGDDERDEEAGKAVGCRTILMKADGDLLAVVKSLP